MNVDDLGEQVEVGDGVQRDDAVCNKLFDTEF